MTNITDVAVYEVFRQWVDSVKGIDGTTAAGAQTVKDSTKAWLSFALGVGKLIAKDIESGDMHITRFSIDRCGGSGGEMQFSFEIAIDGVEIGSSEAIALASLKENLKKAIGVEGAARLDGEFSSENIEIVFDAPVDGKARFTATPPPDAGTSFFMRAKVK